MTTTTAHKRLDELDKMLTPQEWAIRLANEIQQHPNEAAYIKVLSRLPWDELPTRRPCFVLEEQAGDRHPGRKPDDRRARHELSVKLCDEFETLKFLIGIVNRRMQSQLEKLGLQTALRLAELRAMMFEGALTKAPRDLSCAAVRLPDPLIAQDTISRYPMPLAEWHHDFTTLIQECFAHRAAVDLVQAKCFKGHSILFRDLEARLNKTLRTMESAATTANEYIKSQAKNRNLGDRENIPALTFDALSANANSQHAAAIATQWQDDAHREAVCTGHEEWERLRELCDGCDTLAAL